MNREASERLVLIENFLSMLNVKYAEENNASRYDEKRFQQYEKRVKMILELRDEEIALCNDKK